MNDRPDVRALQTPAPQIVPTAGAGVIADILQRLDRVEKEMGIKPRRTDGEPIPGSTVQPLTDQEA